MPYRVKKTKKGGYEVRSPHGVKAKNTTKEKARAQQKLLYAIENDEDFAARIRRRNKMDD